MNQTVPRSYVKVGTEFLMKLTTLTQSEQKILIYLAESSGFSGEARRTQKEVADAVKVDLRTVSKAYAKMKRDGYFAVSGHGRVVMNPNFFMRGQEGQFMAKLERYRAAKGVEPTEYTEVAGDTRAFLDAVVGHPQPENESDDEGLFDEAV